ncbi:uncharacterized protein BJX67DRAFT_231759 [Aspergillus lucknowensis]|uniref:Uncharacterized protein n=1 Tax=Aspergillus lucknowensis TaxID=176173 RepID=A0ABR4LH66_9EURO
MDGWLTLPKNPGHLVLLLKKKADHTVKNKDKSQGLPLYAPPSQLSQPAREERSGPENMDFTYTEKDQGESEEGDTETETATAVAATATKDTEAGAGGKEARATPNPAPKRFISSFINRRTRRRITAAEVDHRPTPPSDTNSRITTTSSASSTSSAGSNTTSLSLVDASLAKCLRSKYRRDTFFLITTDGEPEVAPAWAKFKEYASASSFILDMGRERGMEDAWWCADTQRRICGTRSPTEADYICAAREVFTMASVKLEWSGDEILVRWGKDSDLGVIQQMIQKAWIVREFGFKMINVFKIRVVLHEF